MRESIKSQLKEDQEREPEHENRLVETIREKIHADLEKEPEQKPLVELLKEQMRDTVEVQQNQNIQVMLT